MTGQIRILGYGTSRSGAPAAELRWLSLIGMVERMAWGMRVVM